MWFSYRGCGWLSELVEKLLFGEKDVIFGKMRSRNGSLGSIND